MANESIRQQNMRTVLSRAMKLFIANGVENTSVEMIARESGLTLRSVQNYYRTKNDLIAAVLDGSLAAERAELEAVFAAEPYRSLNGAGQIVAIVAATYRRAIGDADRIFCVAQMQRLLSRVSEDAGEPRLAGNWQYLMEQIRLAFDRGLRDGSITREMEEKLLDAQSVTLALHGIQEQVAFAVRDKALSAMFDPRAAVGKYIRQMELLLAAKPDAAPDAREDECLAGRNRRA